MCGQLLKRAHGRRRECIPKNDDALLWVICPLLSIVEAAKSIYLCRGKQGTSPQRTVQSLPFPQEYTDDVQSSFPFNWLNAEET